MIPYFLSAISIFCSKSEYTSPQMPWEPGKMWEFFERHPEHLADVTIDLHPMAFLGFLKIAARNGPIPPDIKSKLWNRLVCDEHKGIPPEITNSLQTLRGPIPPGANPDSLFMMGVSVGDILQAGIKVEAIKDHRVICAALKHFLTSPAAQLPKLSIPKTPKIPKAKVQHIGLWTFPSEVALQHWAWVLGWKASKHKITPVSSVAAHICLDANCWEDERKIWKQLLLLWGALPETEHQSPQNNSQQTSGNAQQSRSSTPRSPARRSLLRPG